jgi:hypothetical protein
MRFRIQIRAHLIMAVLLSLLLIGISGCGSNALDQGTTTYYRRQPASATGQATTKQQPGQTKEARQ